MGRSGQMPRTSAWLLLAVAVMAAAMTLSVFAKPARAADQSVAMQGFAFTPASVTVNAGDAVTWSNGDTVPHTATANNGAFDTGNVAAGGSAVVTFSTPGTFAYSCTIHPQMTGTVVVQAAQTGGGATPTTAPGGGTAQPTAQGTAAAPSTGTGRYADGEESWVPLAVLGGGVVAAFALGGSVLLFRRSSR